jgi:Na+/H+ antiporter NhaD/arsenite permease-like protein
MKALGIVLIVAGIFMLVVTNISFTKEEKIVDVGPLELNKKEKKTIAWPNYAGGIAVLAGIVLLATAGKKKD